MSCFADPQSEEGPHPDCSSLIGRLLVRFFVAGKEIQVNPLEHHRIPAEDGGCVITLFLSYLCKSFIISNLEAMGVEPLFPAAMSSNVHGCFIRAISEANTF
jgi:hypothetical protein